MMATGQGVQMRCSRDPNTLDLFDDAMLTKPSNDPARVADATVRENDQFLTDRDVAERYRVTRQSVWRWAKSGRLPKPIYLAPHTPRWRLSDLQRAEATWKTAPRTGRFIRSNPRSTASTRSQRL